MSWKTGGKSIVGVFGHLDGVTASIEAVSESGLTVHTVLSPVPRHEISDALKLKPSPVKYFTLLGGVTGMISGVALAAYAGVQWNFVTGAKPVLAWPTFAVVGFEFTILFGILANFVGMLLTSRLPRIKTASYYDPRFSKDRFGVVVRCPEDRLEEVRTLFRESGAEEILDR